MLRYFSRYTHNSWKFQTNPCKHPIVILKDTNRDEAQAMLEFAYTGEVNVAQDLLPTLLHTARSYKIKGLDKVESPVDPPQVVHFLIHPSSYHFNIIYIYIYFGFTYRLCYSKHWVIDWKPKLPAQSNG